MEIEKNANKKKLVVRIVIFAVAVIVAITSITYAVVGIGNKSEGFQTITAAADGDAILYSSGINLSYYCTGSSNEIKHKIKEVGAVYSASLAKYYKLFDAENTYAEYDNIATLNQYAGQSFSIDSVLFDVLCDAYAKTVENKGYNMFAGALNREWQNILYLDDVSETDPAVSEEEAAIISQIAQKVSDLSNFSFEVIDAGSRTVRFGISDEYSYFTEHNEIVAPALDLGLMKNAYILSYVASDLIDAGMTEGYIYSDDGVMINLGLSQNISYTLYGKIKDNITVIGKIPSNKASACCIFKAFSFDGEQYYSYVVNVDGVEYYRHPYFMTENGAFADLLMSCAAYSETVPVTTLRYINIIANAKTTQNDLRQVISEKCGDGVTFAYTLIGSDTPVLYVIGDPDVITLNSGYTVAPDNVASEDKKQ